MLDHCAKPRKFETALQDMHLEAIFPDLAKRFFTRGSKIIDNPWQMATGSGLRHPRLAHL